MNLFDINGYYDIEEVKRICGERYSDIENHIESEKEYDGKVGGFIFYSFVGNQKLIDAGYDGIKHSNIFCVFEPNQIKSINAKHFTESENIYEKKINI